MPELVVGKNGTYLNKKHMGMRIISKGMDILLVVIIQ